MQDQRTIVSTPHYEVEELPDGVVRITRTDQPFESRQEMDETMEHILNGLAGMDRARHGLLVDLRSGPSRNDPQFERAFADYRRGMQQGFGRVAIVVRSAAGRLQVQRLAHEDGVTAETFTDPATALGWLRQGG